MISVRREQVPEYLRLSSYYSNAFGDNEDDQDGSIDIPVDCFKQTAEVANEDDLHLLLRTVRFWVIPGFIESSAEFFSYVLANKECLESAQKIFAHELPFLQKLQIILQPRFELSIMEQCATYGMLGFIKYLRDSKHSWYRVPTSSFTILAAANGRGWPWDCSTSLKAAQYGSLECLQYAQEQGGSLGLSHLNAAVQAGSRECVKYLRDQGVEWDEQLVTTATECRNVNMLGYLIDNGCPVSEGIYYAVVAGDKVDCLQCLHQHGVTLTDVAVEAACIRGAVACLRYALEHGCNYRLENGVAAAYSGHLYCLMCLQEHGAVMTPAVAEWAIYAGKFNCIFFILEHGTSDCGPAACAMAAQKCLLYLQRLHARGVQWDVNTCLAAIRCCRFDCLQYAVAHGCPVDETVTAEAAQQGNIKALEWLHGHGNCAWDATTTTAAVQSDSVDCLEYAVSNGCPYGVPADALDQAPLCREYMARKRYKCLL